MAAEATPSRSCKPRATAPSAGTRITQPPRPALPAEVVNLGFVVNAIEDRCRAGGGLAARVCAGQSGADGGVMLAASDIAGRPCQGGVITPRNTFQKHFSQAEFKKGQHVIDRRAVRGP